jgi:uncharacterized protein YcfJ
MKRLALVPLLATAALAAHAQSFVDRARVQSVEPQYETVQVPREECASQWVTEPQAASRGYGGAVIGGLAGGILGNQVGKGHGREAATAVGAVIGAFAGDRIGNANAAPYPQAQREVRSCRTVYDTQQHLTGYRVTYDYRGYQSTVVTREQPGQTLPVRVSVTPAQEPEYHRPY